MWKHLRYKIKPWKSKGFLGYMKERFPDKDLHHLLGSMGPLKLTDLLLAPVTRAEHQKCHEQPAIALEEKLGEALNYIQDYITYLEKKNEIYDTAGTD